MTHVDPAGVGPVEELPATSWAVLGLLSFGRELTGYDVKKWADASLRFFYWSPAISQVYAELRRLERVGYAASRAVAQDQFRSKRVYTITPAGRDALARWVERSPVETPVLKHGVALRIWLGHVADPVRLRDIVTHHREQAERMRAEADADAASAHAVPEWGYPEVVLRWAERYYAAERDLADSLLEDLDRLAARRPPTGPAG